MLLAKQAADLDLLSGEREAADCLKRWRDGGGTHGTVSSLGRAFTDIQQHVDFVGEVLGKLR